MSVQSHQRLRRAFDEMLDLDADQRADRIAALRAADPALAGELEGLLKMTVAREAFIDTPIVRDVDRLQVGSDDRSRRFTFPTSIDQYRLVRQIGYGGSGTVFEATSDDDERVAVKVLRPGAMSFSSLKRFAREIEILQRLDHPSIVRVIDSGEADLGAGLQPYVVMELVEGSPVTAYAEQRALPLHDRVELIARVAESVQAAHAMGVIHCDLKPQNMLIDHRGEPRLLDFGLARDLDASATSMTTNPAILHGTLAYMSPEQASGRRTAIDTRSDVFALGAIGFELLTGQTVRALEDRSLAEIIRIISNQDAPRLGAVDARCRGDLECILAKALDREPSARYQSAGELGADLRRFLRGEPVLAHPPSALYLMRAFARRHRVVSTAVATAVVTLLLGTAGTTWGFLRSEQQRLHTVELLNEADQARAAAEQATTVARLALADSQAMYRELSDVLLSMSPDQMGRDVRLRDVIEALTARLDTSMTAEPLAEARLRHDLGTLSANLGDSAAAAELFARAHELFVSILGANSDRALASQQSAGETAIHRGLLNEAQATFTDLLDRCRARFGEDQVQTLRAKSALAAVRYRQGQLVEARTMLHDVIAAQTRALGSNHAETLASLSWLGAVEADQGDLDAALATFATVLQARAAQLPADHPLVLTARGRLGAAHLLAGHHDTAASMLESAVAGQQRVLGSRHPQTLASMVHLAKLYAATKRHRDAARIYREVLDATEESNGLLEQERFHCMVSLVDLLLLHGDIEEADRVLESARRFVQASPSRAGKLGHRIAELTRRIEAASADVSHADFEIQKNERNSQKTIR